MYVSTSNLSVIICSKCNNHVNQFSGKKRTICPYCGNLFEMQRQCYRRERNTSVPRASSLVLNHKENKTKFKFSWFRNKNKSKENLIENVSEPQKPFVFLPLLSLNSGRNTNTDLNQDSKSIERFENQKHSKTYRMDYENDIISMELLNELIMEKRTQDNWQFLYNLLITMFTTLETVYMNFQKKNYSCEIQIEKLLLVYDCFYDMPRQLQDPFMKSVENVVQSFNLLKYVQEEIVSLIIILLNPLLDKKEYLHIFALCISLLISIHNRKGQQVVIRVLIKFPNDHFKILLQRIQSFLTYCLLLKENNFNEDKVFRKWKEKLVQFIAFLNVANSFLSVTQRLSYTAFYNCSIDDLNLYEDYTIWQDSHSSEFSFCQYPCVLSINAKKQIIQKESEQQMMFLAKESLILKMQKNQTLEIDTMFLNLNVRRSHLVSDSMNEISKKSNELKKKLKVKFINEPGLDMGGLTKEWFLLLLRQIMHAKSSVFSYDLKSRLNWFHSVPSTKEHKEFYLTGVLMGLAVYNSINLDVRFPLLCYRKLLSPKVCTTMDKDLGICKVTVDDLNSIFPDLGKGLNELLAYNGDVENDICATFEVVYQDCYGNTHRKSLKDNGSSIPVTSENRKEYVNLYCNFLLNSLIQTEFSAFYKGFHTVCDSNALMLVQPEEIENLVCGNHVINIMELKSIVEYENYKATDKSIILFWDVLQEFPETLQKLFLHFTTGSDRIPVGGIQEMPFKISRTNNKNMLPVAYTCFNQLILPPYKDKDVLRTKLLISMENSEGFGLQ